jgi:hypothetical protein
MPCSRRRRRYGSRAQMRIMFVLYSVLIAAGLVFFTVVGLAQH